MKKNCPSCLSTINYFAIRCPYCTSFQSKTAKGGGGYVLIFISILGIWGWITSPKDISGDVQGLPNIAERTMHKAGIEFWNSCGEQVHKRYKESHPYRSRLDNLEYKLQNVSKRKNPDFYEEIKKEKDNFLDEVVSYSIITDLNGYVMAIISCDGRDKLPEDIEKAKELLIKAEKRAPELYKKFPGLKILDN